MSTTIKEVMEEKCITVNAETNIKQVIKLLVKNNVRLLPVVNEEGIVVGAISETDLMKLVRLQPLPTISAVWTNLPKDICEKKVSELMSKKPIVINEQALLKDALNLMNVAGVHTLIVTDLNNKFIGIVKFRKIMEKLMEQV